MNVFVKPFAALRPEAEHAAALAMKAAATAKKEFLDAKQNRIEAENIAKDEEKAMKQAQRVPPLALGFGHIKLEMSSCVHMSKRAEQRRGGSNLRGNRVQS